MPTKTRRALTAIKQERLKQLEAEAEELLALLIVNYHNQKALYEGAMYNYPKMIETTYHPPENKKESASK